MIPHTKPHQIVPITEEELQRLEDEHAYDHHPVPRSRFWTAFHLFLLGLTAALVGYVLIALFSPSQAHAAPFNRACRGDSMRFEGDKQVHMAYSAALGAASRAVIADPWTAFGVSMLPGLYRELWRGECFSFQDMAYNALGAAVGTEAMHLVLTPNRVVFSINTNIF